MGKLRLFAALDVPADRLEALRGVTAGWLGALPGARLVPPGNQHVTVKFIGWLDEGLLAAVAGALGRACAAAAPIELALGGLGAFPHTRRARVVWAGLGGGTEALAALAAACDEALAPLGVPAETRPFRAHLTLARIDPPRRLPEPLPEPPPAARLPFIAGQVVLYRSHLGPGGPRYEALRSLRLG